MFLPLPLSLSRGVLLNVFLFPLSIVMKSNSSQLSVGNISISCDHHTLQAAITAWDWPIGGMASFSYVLVISQYPVIQSFEILYDM